MGISKPKTQDDIIGMVVIHLPAALPLFEAMFSKHKQYVAQERQLEARAVGIAILEALRACILHSYEERTPNDSDYAAQRAMTDSAALEVQSNVYPQCKNWCMAPRDGMSL